MKRRQKRTGFATLIALLATLATAWIVFDDLFAPLGTAAVTVEIPSLCGEPLNDTQADWLALQVEYRHDDTAPEGTVLSQAPPAGSRRKLTEQSPRCTVRVTVSLGRESLKVPDAVGADVRELLPRLREQGFLVETQKRQSPYGEGTVLAADPPSGTLLPKGARILLTVSAGIPTQTVVVPSLSGLSRSDALVRLWLSRLTVGEVAEIESMAPEGSVVRQTPPGGATVTAGSSVDLYVSRETYDE